MLPLILIYLLLILIADARQITFVAQQNLVAQSYDNVPVTPQDTYQFYPTSASSIPQRTLTLKVRPTTVYRPRSQKALHAARMRSLYKEESTAREVNVLTIYIN